MKTKPEDRKPLYSLCIHEASHAIVGIYFSEAIRYLKVVHKPGYWQGYCMLRKNPTCPVIDGCIDVAGSMGQWLYANRPYGQMERSDYTDMRRRRISEWGMNILFHKTRKILKKQKKRVILLANALKSKRYLNEKQIKKLLGVQ